MPEPRWCKMPTLNDGKYCPLSDACARYYGGNCLTSDEQSRGITQVSQAISEMDSTTQQNAALVEESAAAVELTLAEQAILLAQAVAVFRLSDAEVESAQKNTSASVVHKSTPTSRTGTENGRTAQQDNWETF